jgi:uncharacterized lipoprotein
MFGPDREERVGVELVRLAAVVAVAVTLAGCAFSSQPPIVVKPDLVAAQGSLGGGTPVHVNVVDERPSEKLGTRGGGSIGAELTVAQGFPAVLRDAFSQGLKDRGFSPTADLPADGRELRIEIRDLEYKVVMGFWVGTVRAQCSLKAVCQVKQQTPFERLFHGEREEKSEFIKSADANTKFVNDAISSAVNQVLSDQELVQCLASPVESQAAASR